MEPRRSRPRPEVLPAFSRDGVDLTLIRWMLTLTPLQRLRHAQRNAQAVLRLRAAIVRR